MTTTWTHSSFIVHFVAARVFFSSPQRGQRGHSPHPPLEDDRESLDHAMYERLVSAAFQARRKQLTRSLRSLDPRTGELLGRAGLDPRRRPETLSVKEFWTLANSWGDKSGPD